MPPEDREDLALFVEEFKALMKELTDGTHPGLLSPARRQDLAAAYAEIAGVFDGVAQDLRTAPIETSPRPPASASLNDANLTGGNRARKTGRVRAAFDRFRSGPTRKTLARVFRWTNMLLESLAAVLPQAQALKELKQYAENLNADAMEDAAADAGKGPA
jgi:hypothetical protein